MKTQGAVRDLRPLDRRSGVPVRGQAQGRIRLLPPEEARKIAAGEVIDRPAALVREFMDNAIDAGSSSVEVFIEEGGIRRTEVIDDGGGMGREDLRLCWEAHATSKIRSLDDLTTAETLGFRGEALAAAAAVSHLEVLSSEDGREAWLLVVGPGGGEPRLTQSQRIKGTSIRAIGLFDTIPARRRFLKREGSEANLCRQIFTEKALAFPEINFRFTQDGQLKLYLPAASSLKERFAQALLNRSEGAFLHEIAAQGPGFSVVMVVGGPELYRSDRRQQYIFANGRRIQDYSLIQALEYGLQGWFPNGSHPVGAVYIDIDPALADFNIHPAKREVRFRDSGAIHRAITAPLGDYTRRLYIAEGEAGYQSDREAGFDAIQSDAARSGGAAETGFDWASANSRAWERVGPLAMEALLDHPSAFAPRPGSPRSAPFAGPPPGSETAPSPFPLYGAPVAEKSPVYGENDNAPSPADAAAPRIRLVGRLFHLFILIELEDRLYIIDQHAAHERILYDRFLTGPIPRQELLVPIPFTTESGDDDEFLSSRREDLAKLGILIIRERDSWHIEALPENWKLSDSETVQEILTLRTAGENIAEHWAATLSCHGAVKDGDYLDDTTALALAEAALSLPIPRCPHGRPVWSEISRETLFRAVRRV
ncbi:DNA mismatch repair protein MutL [Spirochaetia bacterium]|nr:DNA mismatch repair protein MutL [Spirochaetia bacterium]